MNLERDTIEDLANLITKCDDKFGDHVVWVDESGCVHVSLIPYGKRAWEVADNARFRLETFHRGNSYVGPEAAKDKRWMKDLHEWLLESWRSGVRDYVD